MTEQTTAIAKPVTIVTTLVREYLEQKQMILPEDYAVENALKFAWLMIQETKDRNNALALTVCSPSSIQNALLSMVLQGLSPDKNQGYFIVYGKSLAWQRSYFGSQALAKRLSKADDVFAEVVYKKDEFEYEINRGQKKVIKHIQKIENVDPRNILAAYAIIVYPDGKEITEVMSWEQIKISWGKSPMKPVNADGTIKAGTTHHDQPDQMAMRTVINRLCKPIINSSSDSALFKKYVIDVEDQMAEAQFDEEVEANANKKALPEKVYVQEGEKFEEQTGYHDAVVVDEETGEIIPDDVGKDEPPF